MEWLSEWKARKVRKIGGKEKEGGGGKERERGGGNRKGGIDKEGER